MPGWVYDPTLPSSIGAFDPVLAPASPTGPTIPASTKANIRPAADAKAPRDRRPLFISDPPRDVPAPNEYPLLIWLSESVKLSLGITYVACHDLQSPIRPPWGLEGGGRSTW